MKKVVSLLLALTMVFTLCGCGSSKKAFNISKDAYNKITEAYEITEDFGSDIYEAWRLAINEKKSVEGSGTKYLAKELSLTEDELNEGVAVALAEIDGNDWNEIDDTKKDNYRDTVKSWKSSVFSYYSDDLFSFCVKCVIGAYKANGEIDKAQVTLDEAKSLMKEMSEKYSDYEHYPNLKGYYTTTNSFFDFCKNPTGSFNQLVDTINDYKNEARNYRADLDYIFED